MKFLIQIFIILVVFLKTETLLSDNNLFNVNNIELEKKDKDTNNDIANAAIKKGYNLLIKRILLKEDYDIISNLNFSLIKQLIKYYQISEISNNKNNKKLLKFSITFDKDKIHDLFYEKGISYSDILDKELYILPIFISDSELFIFNNNFFYKNWNEVYKNDLLEFILPTENIETIQKINNSKNYLIDLNIEDLFKEYSNKNLALVLIEDKKIESIKIYIKTFIQGKNISKSIKFNKKNLFNNESYIQIISYTKKELINLVKSENLIDIRTPYFLNAKLDLDQKSNVVELNLKIKNIDLIENLYVQELNKDYMKIRIKYLGKLNKIIKQLKREKIELKLVNDQWIIKTL